MRLALGSTIALGLISVLGACGDARDDVDGGGGGGALHPIPFVAEHTAAARANVLSCRVCHGTELDGGAAAQTSCTDCHADPGGLAFDATDWRTNCTFCHGVRDENWNGTPLTAAAPPQSADGAAPQDNTNPKVGAHQAHLVAGTFSNPLACGSCHGVPPQTFPASLTHVDGTADVEFSTTARQGVTSPGYARATGTCAVYCHGSTAALGNNTSPAWTTTGIACGACHTTTPTSGFHNLHIVTQGVACASCHPGASVSPPSVDVATHVNGTFEAVITANPAATPPTTNGSFSSWPASCTPCHPSL
jgi:predicted CxxxxCH...CXXCH cytochrome family protein